MKPQYDYKHIIPQSDGSFTVKGYGTYERHSVLAGQVKIVFLASFGTFEEAQAAYPDADPSHPLLEPVNAMPITAPDWFDPADAGERWDDDY